MIRARGAGTIEGHFCFERARCIRKTIRWEVTLQLKGYRLVYSQRSCAFYDSVAIPGAFSSSKKPETSACG
jgi:hypothetical protein